MIVLKQVIHYPDTNSVEATWVDGNGNVVRCHSYDDRQMDMLRADLGDDAPAYEELMALVEANQKPLQPPQIPQVVSRFQARAALHLAGLLDDVEAMMSLPDTPVMAKLAWANAQEFERASPTIAALAGQVGLTDQQIDDLFTTAAGIKA